jgi:hypothetical protein
MRSSPLLSCVLVVGVLSGCDNPPTTPESDALPALPLFALYPSADITIPGNQYSDINPPMDPQLDACNWMELGSTTIATAWDVGYCEDVHGVSPWLEYTATLTAGTWRIGLNAINVPFESNGLGEDPTWYPEFEVANSLTEEVILVPASNHEVNYGYTIFEVPTDGEYTVRYAWLNDQTECCRDGGLPLLDANIRIMSVFFDRDHADSPSKRVVESVSGSGSRAATEQEGDWRTFSFTALRYADGTVEGQWQRIRRADGNAADSRSHGIVTCFTIVGDEAWLGGYATSGIWSDFPNNEVRWQVKDNGQGEASLPDQISLQGIGRDLGTAAGYCANRPTGLELRDIVAGNIQIRQ